MLCSPRARSLRDLSFVPLTVLITALCLFVFAPVLRAQQVSGVRSPVKEKSSLEQKEPIQIRAARGAAPLSRLYDYLKVEASKVRVLPALPPQEVQEESESKKLKVGTVRAFPQPVKASSDAALYSIAEGDVRVMGVVSEGAVYTRVHFNLMSLPAGARVFVYSAKNPDDFYGPYEGHGPSDDGTFWTPPVEGDEAVVEYFIPRGAAPNDAFQISEVSHIYKRLFTNNDSAGSCNLEVTSDWATIASSVGALEFTSGDGEYLCTGTLLNNLASDFTPYLLTANHCFNTQMEAQSLRVYWSYKTGDSPPPGTAHTDGANLLSTGASSDYTFVQLTGSLPGGLFFSGWTTAATPLSTSVTGIHHPEGSHKRISFGTTTSGCPAGLPGPCSNFTHVGWNSGTTEPGSSGSGLWKGSAANAQLVGTLTGGEASCDSPSGVDHYGSFSATYPNISSFLTGGNVDLEITESTAYDQVAPGSKIVYFITVTNRQGAASGSVSITNNLPAELTYVSCSASGGTCDGTGNNRTISFPSLAAGSSATAVLIATVNNAVASGTVISNTATVSSSSPDPNQSNNAATAAATVSLTPIKPMSNGRILFSSDRGGGGTLQTSGIYTIGADGNNETLLISSTILASCSAWSPDGKKFAYGRRGGNGLYSDEIYIANADGTGSVKVASNVYQSNSRIAWSPNGSKLAFIGTGSSIYIVNVDGTGLSKLPGPATVNDLSWSPDGSRFAYSNRSDVFVMNLDGSGQTNLTQGRINNDGEPASNVLPRWSPDGTKLLFSADSNNHRYVYVINADGTGLSRLISLHQSTQPGWSPDGTKITFIATNLLYVSNSDGTGQVQLTNLNVYNSKPDWQPLAGAAQFSQSGYTLGEAAGAVTITVNRTDSSTAASVDYATSDTAGLRNCNQANTGIASSRCDYATTVGTLRFAAGESSRTISIPVVDDGYVEGSESFTVRLSNPVGVTLGAASTATVTLTDNDSAPSNPIASVPYFVRQQYIDFLGREPDPGGFAAWQSILNNCAAGDTSCDRISVSSGFFRSPEFQERGSFVFRIYPIALGRNPTYAEFMPDLAKVSGFLDAQQLEANKVAFVNEFVARAEFQSRYRFVLNQADYVDKLLQTAGLTNVPGLAASLKQNMAAGASPAQVLRTVIDTVDAYNKFYN